MWICKKCMQEIEDDSFEFCWSCSEPKAEDNDKTWLCSACKTEVEDSFAFCSHCGEPKEHKKEPLVLPGAKSNGAIEIAKPKAIVPAPVSLSVKPASSVPIRPVYDASIFASQFPVWDLLPPAMLVRRIKRSI